MFAAKGSTWRGRKKPRCSDVSFYFVFCILVTDEAINQENVFAFVSYYFLDYFFLVLPQLTCAILFAAKRRQPAMYIGWYISIS